MQLLEQVFEIINKSGLDYCIQNKYEMMPEEIPSDIDMMYRNADEYFLDRLVIKIAKETGLLITQKIVQGYYEYTYILSYPIPERRFQLQLDFYRAISKKHFPNVMPAEDMLKNKRFYKCFYVPDYFDELKYMFIRRTIKNDMNLEHLEIARNLYQHDPEGYYNRLIDTFGINVTNLIVESIKTLNCIIFEDNISMFRESVKEISRRNCRSGRFHYLYRKFQISEVIPKRIIRKAGISIAFLSPDGGGKSTSIEKIKEQCGGSFYGDIELHFRPHYFANAGAYKFCNKTVEEKVNPNPHDKKMNGKVKSILRFFFYNMDFILGTWFKVNVMKIKKKLVIFDRYYYDYYADMKRYQYSLSPMVAKIFAWSIPKPDIIFVLDAPADILYARKQELTVGEIDRQRKIYRNFAKCNSRAILVDATQTSEEVARQITKKVLQYKAKQTARLLHCTVDKEGHPIE